VKASTISANGPTTAPQGNNIPSAFPTGGLASALGNTNNLGTNVSTKFNTNQLSMHIQLRSSDLTNSKQKNCIYSKQDILDLIASCLCRESELRDVDDWDRNGPYPGGKELFVNFTKLQKLVTKNFEARFKAAEFLVNKKGHLMHASTPSAPDADVSYNSIGNSATSRIQSKHPDLDILKLGINPNSSSTNTGNSGVQWIKRSTLAKTVPPEPTLMEQIDYKLEDEGGYCMVKPGRLKKENEGGYCMVKPGRLKLEDEGGYCMVKPGRLKKKVINPNPNSNGNHGLNPNGSGKLQRDILDNFKILDPVPWGYKIIE